MRQQKRISANLVRKFLPSLRRVTTKQNGRRWTVDGKKMFYTLQEVIDAYAKPNKDETTKQVTTGPSDDEQTLIADQEVAADA